MDEAVISAMRAEEAALKAKLSAVRAFLQLYAPSDRMAVVRDSQPAFIGPVSPLEFARPENTVTSETILRKRPNEYAENIRGIATGLIRQSLDPVPTRAIVQELERRGIEIRGQDKISAVSALLSRSDAFKNVDRQGWMLVEPAFVDGGDSPKENGAAEAAPDAGGVAAPSSDDRPEHQALFD